jgi:hypothetical protein
MTKEEAVVIFKEAWDQLSTVALAQAWSIFEDPVLGNELPIQSAPDIGFVRPGTGSRRNIPYLLSVKRLQLKLSRG